MELRDYQDRIVAKTKDHIANEVPSVCITSPTGSGKSVMGLALAQHMSQLGMSVGWVAMRRNLLRQAAETNRAWNQTDINFISMFDSAPPKVDAIILDECLPYDSEVESIVNGERITSKIGDIVENNEASHVLSMNEEGQAEYQPILDRTPMGKKELIEVVIETEEGEEKTLLITEEGRVWVDGEYKKAKDLEIGDTTMCVGECWQTYNKESLPTGDNTCQEEKDIIKNTTKEPKS